MVGRGEGKGEQPIPKEQSFLGVFSLEGNCLSKSNTPDKIIFFGLPSHCMLLGNATTTCSFVAAIVVGAEGELSLTVPGAATGCEGGLC